jgi:hypothetical protein
MGGKDANCTDERESGKEVKSGHCWSLSENKWDDFHVMRVQLSDQAGVSREVGEGGEGGTRPNHTKANLYSFLSSSVRLPARCRQHVEGSLNIVCLELRCAGQVECGSTSLLSRVPVIMSAKRSVKEISGEAVWEKRNQGVAGAPPSESRDCRQDAGSTGES